MPSDSKQKARAEVRRAQAEFGYECSAERFSRRLRALEEEGKRAICMAYIGRAPDGDYLGISLRIPYDGEILQGKR